MPSVLLTWNTDLPDPWHGGYAAAVASLAAGGSARGLFPVPPRTAAEAPEPGTEVWLVLGGGEGRHGTRGLAGHGTVAGQAPDASGGMELDVDFGALLPLGDHVPLSLLQQELTGLPWAETPGPAPVPEASVPQLRRFWSQVLGPGAEPLSPVSGTLDPGARIQLPANRHEHDAGARRICLAFHGPVCAACALDPEERYGPGAQAVLQVHHLVPPAGLGPGYVLDPVADLVPLCPTCHAVAHTRVPVPNTPAEIRGRLTAGAGPGGPAGAVVHSEVLSEQQIRAREDAARLRGFR